MLYKMYNSLVYLGTNIILFQLDAIADICMRVHMKYLRSSRFFPETVREWNGLPLAVVESGSVSSFQAGVNLWINIFIIL